MFRMSLNVNHKKTKVMHCRRAFKDVEDAGYEAGWVRFEQPDAPEKTPANARTRQRQPYPGFLTDECLSGRAHHNRALAIGHAHARLVKFLPRLGRTWDSCTSRGWWGLRPCT